MSEPDQPKGYARPRTGSSRNYIYSAGAGRKRAKSRRFRPFLLTDGREIDVIDARWQYDGSIDRNVIYLDKLRGGAVRAFVQDRSSMHISASSQLKDLAERLRREIQTRSVEPVVLSEMELPKGISLYKPT